MCKNTKIHVRERSEENEQVEKENASVYKHGFACLRSCTAYINQVSKAAVLKNGYEHLKKLETKRATKATGLQKVSAICASSCKLK